METRGTFEPTDAASVRERYEALGPTAQTVTREVARAMAFDREEYADRVTADVVATARDALFASSLVVHLGTREEFEAAREVLTDVETVERGNPNVGRVAWHVAAPADAVLAATYENEPDAAVAALRRQVFGEVYRPILDGAEPAVGDAPGDGS